MRTITVKEWMEKEAMRVWLKDKSVKPDEAIRRRAIGMAMQKHPSDTIALAVGRTRRIIFRWLKTWNEQGPAGLIPKPRGGRINQTLTPEKEREILASCAKEAELGRLTSLGSIHKKVCEAAKDDTVSQATTWNILKRNQWRKLVPRKHHAKGNLEAQTAFKEKGGFRQPKKPWQAPPSL